jgi:hypothetical protein
MRLHSSGPVAASLGLNFAMLAAGSIGLVAALRSCWCAASIISRPCRTPMRRRPPHALASPPC